MANGVQVECCDVGLQIENINEVLGPIGNAASAGGMEVVVIAEKAGLAIIGHVNIVSGL